MSYYQTTHFPSLTTEEKARQQRIALCVTSNLLFSPSISYKITRTPTSNSCLVGKTEEECLRLAYNRFK